MFNLKISFLFLALMNQEPQKKEDSPKQESQNTVMKFMKIESLGVSPFGSDEKIVYTKSAGDKIVKEFKEVPVYMVKYEKKNDKTVSTFSQVGTVSCVFFTEGNWIAASLNSKASIPEGYVLRAHTVAKKNDTRPDKTLEVQDASIVQFYLKPKEMAVSFSGEKDK